ncbi:MULTISPECIES: DUF1488 domain-containing protein [Cupriavidus]|uniref:DUF1488 domain-containing protein n=1 Tax=Cupriavidus TaxID=106589 RepID=UPI00036CB398|nr:MULTISPECIES: DUF1488 domain-containing protein [Cupriavidus]
MALSFPNPSRSYDAAKHCVWFWGYDNAREVTFLVNDAVLAHLDPAMGPAEPEVLAAFDRHREQILELARTRYAASRQNMYLLS